MGTEKNVKFLRIAPPRERRAVSGRILIFRHPLWVRVLHWTIAASTIVLIMSGLNILRAHPHLYWGEISTFGHAWIDIPKIPDWLTIPNYYSLAQGRRWHFFFAWFFVIAGFFYVFLLLATGRIGRRWLPNGRDLREFLISVKNHAMLKFPKGEEAKDYNVIQKLTYIFLFFLVLPMMVATGLTMSPGINATGIGKLTLELFGGRQSARTLHFLAASAIILFLFIHITLVIITGLFNNLRAITTGWFAIDVGKPATSAEKEAIDDSAI